MKEDTLSVSKTKIQDVLMLKISGEIDLLTAPTLERAIRDALDETTSGMILDFRPTSYIDSEGLKCVIRANNAVTARNAKLWVVVPENSFVERILQVPEFWNWSKSAESLKPFSIKSIKTPRRTSPGSFA
jgi:anti-anti-sigma factor